VSLVPYSFTQWDQTERISRGQARPGDLVFFFRAGAHHVGMYLGDGQMVHAANPTSGVIVSSIDDAWYASRLSGFGRVVG
jgi:cell wall-associated NlpC family hydrolase